ncbi:MAG: hypothetical protein ACLR1T_11825 [Evtepia gabavorous]
MDHRQARKTGWTIIGCGCVFIILTKLWVGLAMAALGLLLIALGAGAPTAGRFCSSCPPTPTSAPSATAPCKRARWCAPPRGIYNRGTTGIWQEKNHLTRARNGSIPRG